MTRASLILTRADIRRLMGHADYLAALEEGFRATAAGRAHTPPPMHIEADVGGLHAKGALLKGRRSCMAVKANSNFPTNPDKRGLPTIQGALLLFDADDGSLLAVMDSSEITLMRTAAATALAARYLARENATTLLICGCGAQAPAQAAALAQVRSFKSGRAWDADRSKAVRFAAEMTRHIGIPFEAVSSLSDAAPGSDVIVTCTSAREPFLDETHASRGTFVAAVGADSPAKNEIAPALMAKAKVFADVTEQALAMGDLRHAVVGGAMTDADVKGDLAELVSGKVRGRTDDGEIIIFDSTGTAIEDVASAALAYERALGAGFPSVELARG